MNLQQELDWRYSTKKFNPSKKLTEEQIHSLLYSLQMSPSAGNTQPWYFFVAKDSNAKEKIAKAAKERFPKMYENILQSSLAIVACSRNDIDDHYLSELLSIEDKDGRYSSSEQMQELDRARRFAITMHRDKLDDLPKWISNQLYVSIGFFLMSAAQMKIDTLAFESIDWKIIESELETKEKNVSPQLILLAGFRAEDDHNNPTRRPKARWPQNKIFSFLD